MEDITAVLTGDFIGSTEAEPNRLERSMAELATQAGFISDAIDHDTRFTRFRGDGWQIHLPSPSHFLWITVYLNAMLRSDPNGFLPTRIAIGVGQTDRLGRTGLSDASGTAFIESGRALDDMVVAGQTIALKGEKTDAIQRSTIAFIDERISGWSPEQAEVVRLKLKPGHDPTQADIAAILGISRQAVGSRFQTAGLSLVLKACDAFRDHNWQARDV